ncbi:hypothetical protein QVD17_31607 [Tagetes erecta]|uniref:Uncharacterized protein n=1 Tax=Tagetes erecta TaxID=13708 RepID=A0AAD8NNP3_TARER|nr:hypothetical protein QVD17_31607 [Tagetes erecta]
MGLVSISIRTHFLAFNGFPSHISDRIPRATMATRRRRVLFTFATLFVSMLQKILKRMHICTNPTREKAKVLYGIERQLLAILSFVDDHVMVIEDLVEAIWPSSTCVFDKIDDVVKASESLPVKFDDFCDHEVPALLQRVPFYDRVFKKDEKEIVIDITCHGYKAEPGKAFEYENVAKPALEGEKARKDDVTDALKPVDNLSVEEAIDNINKESENMEDANAEFLYTARASSSADELLQSQDQDQDQKQDQEDPIFDLFEAGWHMSPRALSSTSSTTL